MISKQEVEHIAKLARLGLSEKEIEKMRHELAGILDYVNQLEEVDIAGVQPTSHSLELTNVYRIDDADEQTKEVVDKMLAQVPQKEGRYVKVKEILT